MIATELRCDNKILHGILRDDHILEVKCRSERCGARRGVVVLHQFNLKTGDLLTKRYKTPERNEE